MTTALGESPISRGTRVVFVGSKDSLSAWVGAAGRVSEYDGVMGIMWFDEPIAGFHGTYFYADQVVVSPYQGEELESV